MAKSDWLSPETRDRGYAAILKRANWAVREYQRGDEVAILQLCHELFGVSFTAAEWQWRMFQNPSGPAVSRVAYLKDNGQIVGHLAALPIDLKIGDFSRKIFFLVDSVVDPAYQGRGIHAALTLQMTKIASDQWAGPLVGLPNTRAYGPNIKLGGTQIVTMAVHFKILNWAGLVRARLHSKLLSKIAGMLTRFPARPNAPVDGGSLKIHEVRQFDHTVDELWQRLSARFSICAKRTSAVLNWRHFDRPGSNYSVFAVSTGEKWIGYIVVRLLEKWGLRLGTIVDLFFDPDCPAAGKLLLKHAETHLRDNQAHIVWGLFACPPAIRQVLRKQGFFKAPQLRGVRQFHFVADFVTIDHERPDLYQRDGARFRDAAQWFLSLGDTDLA